MGFPDLDSCVVIIWENFLVCGNPDLANLSSNSSGKEGVICN